ncbi:hypothetical protein T492DRAFT_141450 [Pavlovales sp. CCMP2436]|nr:hypothetical protein T492DRAFT_141450 [Pavlovales sp. CCMP2436]
MARDGSAAEKSWLAWHHEECQYIYATRSSVKMLHVLAPGLRYLVTFLGLINPITKALKTTSTTTLVATETDLFDIEAYTMGLARVATILAFIFVPIGAAKLGDGLLERHAEDIPVLRRLFSFVAAIVCFSAIAAPLAYGLTNVHEILRALVAGFYLLAFLVTVAFAAGLTLPVVTKLCWCYDYGVGLLLQMALFVLSGLGFVNEIQVFLVFLFTLSTVLPPVLKREAHAIISRMLVE